MRPGPIRPGDWGVGEVVAVAEVPASMRPGPIRPGDPKKRANVFDDDPELQ